jgi:hypothetical protein
MESIQKMSKDEKYSEVMPHLDFMILAVFEK